MNQEYSRRKRRERLVKGAALLSFCLLSVGFLYLSIFLDQKVLDYPNIVNTLDAVPFLILFVCVISVYNKVYDFANRRMYRQLYSVGVTLFLIQVFMVALPYFGYEFRISKKVMLLSLLLQGAICFLWLGMFRKIYFTAVKPYRVLLIEGSWDAESIRLKFLFSSRKYRIDELPQLLNVLKGEMSLIGPRPEREYYYRLYDKTMPEFRYRLNVKAGLSGYAQVWGRYNTKLREKLMMDLMYIQDYSFLLDIKLMLETIRVVFDHRSSEGVE